jgi:hypothetical protein
MDVSIPRVNFSLTGSVSVILRLEGLAVAAVSAALYARTGASWGLFAALWLMPDLSLLGYLAGPRRGASLYNGFHSYFAPLLMALAGILLSWPVAWPFALLWMNHIGVDRLLGFGLKSPESFSWTHLGNVGKPGKAS